MLVSIGVYFSYVQFKRSFKSDSKEVLSNKQGIGIEKNKDISKVEKKVVEQTDKLEDPTLSENSSDPVSVTKIEASLQGIKVSSPVLGVIILIISLLFFYLYLIFVYPVKDAL